MAALFETVPPLLTTKFLTGHTYAASGMLGLELVRLVMAGLRPAPPGYATRAPLHEPGTPVQVALINAAGFGGNAVSCLVSRA